MKFLGSLFGVGYLPVAPGTYASALMAGLWMLLHYLGWWPAFAYANFCVPIGAGVIIGAIAVFAGNKTGEKDPKWFVLDECAGQWVALIGAGAENYWLDGVIVFGLFRVLDIIKPGMVRSVESLRGGWGIVADDVAAGVLTCASWRLVSLLVLGL